MFQMGYSIFCLLSVGLCVQYANGQSLLTVKCLNDDWSLQFGRCYQVVDYTHSYSKALSYCQKYGARLADPVGYAVNSAVADLVQQAIPTATMYRIEYRYLSAQANLATGAYKSDGRQTTVDGGLWGRRQPDISAGLCAYVDLSTRQWFMGSCDSLMPFVCEIDPCPAGDRDTFMCNGKCIGQALVCDEKDDCGNNLDEQNCQSEKLCTYTYTQNEGSLTLPTVNNRYRANQNCSWTIITEPSTQINVKFDSFFTEDTADFVEVYDGDLALGSSQLILRLSGTTSQDFTTSYNFLIIRFVSDFQEEKSGFALRWSTTYECMFDVLNGYTFSNTDIQFGSVELGTRVDEDKCRTDCGDNCFGFSYNKASRTCYYINKLPVLMEDARYDLHTKTCPSFTTFKGSVPVFEGELTATSTWSQLATPYYPRDYPGNTELEYCITTEANNLITLQAVTIDLCYGDYVYIYDKSHKLLETLTSDSVPHYILSTGNMVYVRMVLERHRKCNGVLLEYKQGCSLTFTGGGMAESPGYVAGQSYPPLMICTWLINAPSPDRSITLIFEDFQLGTGDALTLEFADNSVRQATGTELQHDSITTPDHVTLTMVTSSRGSGRGFSVSFSPGCPSLQSTSYVLSSSSSNYGDIVNIECAEGYYFTAPYVGHSMVIVTCHQGGAWSVTELPVCARGFCGPAGSVDNGYVESSTGGSGGEMTSFACNDGFSLAPGADIYCQADSTWSTRPSCTSPQCQAIDSLTAAESQIALGDGTSHGSVAQLSCPEPSEIMGAQTVQCENGNWDFASTGVSFCQDKPCGTPLITNAKLTPAMPYTVGQEITAECHEGYDLSGQATFLCGSTELPACNPKTCNLDGMTNLVVSGSTDTKFPYGTSVTVTCDDGYEFEVATTTTMTLTCLASEVWDSTPPCRRKGCGEPYEVGGSTYAYIDGICFDNGCSFTLTCRSKYELFGKSDNGDNIVRCHAGRWTFGNLHCEGGNCEDPGYPPSGYLTAVSFQEKSKAGFGCFKSGNTPRNSDNTLSTGITCIYDSVDDSMKWDGEVPECIDTEDPVIVNCPGGTVYINTLDAPGFSTPYPEDNDGVKSFTITPDNINPRQNVALGQYWIYSAEDYSGNKVTCRVTISIPRWLECRNSVSTALPVADFSAEQEINPQLYVNTYEDFPGQVVVESDGTSVKITPDSSTLTYVQEVQMTAFDTTDDSVLDTCTLQFRFTALGCATWPLNMPNTITNCASRTCNLQCEDNYYFMDLPDNSVITMTCENDAWNRSPPICALATENYVRFSIFYNYIYSINAGISDTTVCHDVYEPQVRSNLQQFATEMASMCNQLDEISSSNNKISIVSEDFTLTFIDGSQLQRMTVRFKFIIELDDESADDTTTIKQTCANAIQTRLNIAQSDSAISQVSGDTGAGCGSGLYLTGSTQESYQYECLGGRKYFSKQGTARLCVECPVGKYYDVASDDCVDCPSGRYGSGTSCVPCPNGQDPGITGLTSIDGCSKRAICANGYFSETGLAPCKMCPRHFYNSNPASRTCAECLNGEITANEGSDTSDACLTEAQAVAQGVTTPCTDDTNLGPVCKNGGTCSIVRHDFKCTCPEGYTGTTCETQVTACSSNPCQNEQSCHLDGNGGFVCECNLNPSSNTELTGTYCEKERHDCVPGICKNNATCHNSRGAFQCKCPTHGGYKSLGVCDIPIDQCEDNPCGQGECVPHGIYYRTCDCLPGYEGLDCNTNTDDCTPNPCQNGATCEDGVDSFTCRCIDGYHGSLCQFTKACGRECTDSITTNCHKCTVNGTDSCTNIANSYTCICLPDYTGLCCEVEISPCSNYPCQSGGTCVPVSATEYTCECLEPWTGDNCEMQVNNCPNGDQCLNGGQCYSTPSGYRCKCPHNYIGDNCSIEYDLCARANPCLAGGGCSLTEDGTIECNCPEGYDGDYCQIELETCTPSPCANGGMCTETSGGVTCSCVEGFDGDYCENNINDCAEDSCSEVQECQDGIAGFTCICAPGRWGQDCTKEVGVNFDYIIQPRSMSRVEASRIVFGDGITPITALSVSFWVRYTSIIGDAVLLNVYGSNADDGLIPESPDFQLVFEKSGIVSTVSDSGTRRKKRATDTLDYNVNIADGYWHYIAVVWTNNPGEIDLHVDGVFRDQVRFGQGQNLGTSGFVVFGKFDPVTGTSDPANSFQGRISQLYILDFKLEDNTISSLYTRSSTLSLASVLSHERTVMLQYPVVYTSELEYGRCLLGDNACQGLNPGATVPTVDSCPSDTLTLTERGGIPSWTEPAFSGTTAESPISNYVNNATQMDWGVYGISYAAFDGSGSAAVCIFRLYNYKELPCRKVAPSDAPSSVEVAGGKRYSAQCSVGEAIPGDLPVFQICNMYSMWNGDIKYNYEYAFPVCSATSALTVQMTISLDVQLTGKNCQAVRNDYYTAVLNKLSTFNNNLDGKLCPSNCVDPLSTAFSCTGQELINVNIDLGLIEMSMEYEGSTITAEEAVQLAVGDLKVFDYDDEAGVVASPVITSLAVTSGSRCTTGSEVSGDSCVLCGAGTRYVANARVCERCAVGSFRSLQSSNFNQCENCHVSSTTVSDGSTLASQCRSKCQPGQYNNAEASDTCSPCQVGFYQDTLGSFSCKACTYTLTTAGSGAGEVSQCVSPSSLTTTTEGAGPNVGAATEDTGIGIGVVVAIVLAVLIVLTIALLIICFCCCRDILPCFKKKQIVAPTTKEGYYGKKYGPHHMQFVSYNLRDVREKKGRPLDKEPIVEHPLSDETGSVKTDISVHVPVFHEKMDGKVTRKSLYMSNGGQNLNASRTRSLMGSREPTPRTYELPITSSPRGMHYDEVEEGPDDEHKHRSKRRRRRHRKERSGERSHRSTERRAHRHSEGVERSHRSRSADQPENDYDEIPMATVPSQMPKALAPMPHRIKSMPASDIHIRPLSPLSRPRPQVELNEYEDFLHGSPKKSQQRAQKSNFMLDQYDDNEPQETPVRRIEVESDEEDLR